MRHRQAAFYSLINWQPGAVVSCLPAILYIAVFLFFGGLWQFFKTRNNIVGDVVGVSTSILAFFIIVPSLPFSQPHHST
jgi:lipopolysaccharide export LptBFGC system permease protein LptF